MPLWSDCLFYFLLVYKSQAVYNSIACVATISVGLEQRKTEEWDFWCVAQACEKWGKSQNKKEWGGGGEERKRFQMNSLMLKTMFTSKWGLWLARLVKHCWHVSDMDLTFERARCIQSLFTKIIIFFTKQGFSRELDITMEILWCNFNTLGFQSLHIIAEASGTLFAATYSFNFNITFLNATKNKITNHGSEILHFSKNTTLQWKTQWFHLACYIAMCFQIIGTLTFQ